MKLVVNLCLFLLALLTFIEKSYSLTDYQIKEICKKQKNKSTCIKNFIEKRSNLEKGNQI